MYSQITVERRGDVEVLTLNRPERMNAWTPTMSAELTTALQAGNNDPSVGAFILTGAGRGFCAGADIEAVFKARADGDDNAARPSGQDWTTLVRSSKPIVAAINGAAIGIGITMVLSCDRLVASDQAKISLRFVKMGITPELASSHWLVQRCGFGEASDLALSGRTISGAAAAAIKLVDEVVPHDQLMERALQVAGEYAENPNPQLLAVKRLLTSNGSEVDFTLVQRRELQELEAAYQTPEHHEAIAAFMEKRPPKFR